MKYLAIHTPEGAIKGRLKCSSDATAELYKDRAVELTQDEFNQPLEKTHVVDMDHLKTTGQKKLKLKDNK